MRPKKSPQQKRFGHDRFGYRPTPEKRLDTGLYHHQEGQTARQQMLDKIQYERLRSSWREENRQKGREKWHDLGNKALPIEKYKSDIMKMVATNRISLLAGETGSGKSTQLAQYALEMGYDHIVYLQPRRVTTDGIADRIDEELSEQFVAKNLEKPAHLVGMAHSERTTLHEDSVIQVMTSAVFKKRAPQLQEAWRDKKILIVADEVHEGNIETEFAVAMSAEMMTEQENWNMVLMSATMNEEEIQQAYTPINGKPIPKIEVEGRPHEISYQEEPSKHVVQVFSESCLDGNKTLIFTEGQRAMGAIENQLRREHPEVRILKLHSKITEAERHAIFKTEVPGVHTVIISTSAGQSGLTIPGVDRVISDGMTKSPELDDENAEGLPRRTCSQAELTQQMGRGGRDIAGAKFFLARQLPYKRADQDVFTTDFTPFSQRAAHAPADIYHTVITRNVLSTAAMGRDFYRLNEYLIHSVTQGTIEEAYQVLKMLGAVNKDNECTAIGRLMDHFPLRPELSRALVEVVQSGTKHQQRQMAALAAAIEAGGLAKADSDGVDYNHKHMPPWAQDDFMAQLILFEFMNRREQAEANFLELPENEVRFSLDEVNAHRAKKQYIKLCRRLGLTPEDATRELIDDMTSETAQELKEMLVKGMPHLLYEKVGQRRHRGRLKRMPDGTKVRPKPTEYLRNVLGPPKEQSYDLDREISNRSALAKAALLGSDVLVAGYPRWYYDDNEVLHNVIEKGFVLPRKRVQIALGGVAMSVQERTIITKDGRLRRTASRRIGSLETSRESSNDTADTSKKIQLMTLEAMERPGPAQRELRRLRDTINNLTKRIPARQRAYYTERPLLTHNALESLVYRAAADSSSVGELDAKLRRQMYEQDMRLDTYISTQSREYIERNMPDSIEINQSPYILHYANNEEATPYIADFQLENAAGLPRQVTIADGEREVFFRFHYGSDDDRYLTAQEVRDMAESSVY